MVRKMKENEAFGHWFSGFTDGEGCFTISRPVLKNYVYMYYPKFIISVRTDDAGILRKCQSFFGIGNIYKITPRKKRYQSNPSVQWQVYKKEDLMLLVNHFDSYPLRAKKRNDYSIWREGIILCQEPNDARKTEAHLLSMEEITTRLNEVKRYNDKISIAG